MLRFRTSVTVLIRGPLRLLLLHPLRPLRPLDPLDSPLGSQPPHLPLRQLPARATHPWNQTQSQAAVSPASQPAEADPWNQPYQQSPHDDPWNQPQGEPCSGGSAARETTRGISLSPRLRLLRFLRQCRAICRAMTRGTSPNRFRSRLPAMTRGINRRQFHNRLRRPPAR